MERLTRTMRQEILDVQGFLTQGLVFALTPEERQGLLESSQKLLERLNALSDQVLVAGLLGGTGVGKSTVMNALAGAEIATTSHRRPNTDRVLLYRHEATELPGAVPRTKVPWQEIVHQAAAVRQVILCDLPDFDSLVGEHRQRVLGFLEHLDVLVFVTSPEKYADESLYAFLAGVPKARPNFYFVLNKVDLLFQGEDLEPGYRQLTGVTRLFREYLQRAEVPDPLVYPVSAQEAFQGPAVSPWNQFPLFRREIFREREAKEVMSVKSANLDREIQELHSRLETEFVHIDKLLQVLDGFVKQFEEDRREMEETGQGILGAWIDTELKGYVLGHLETLAPLVGPGYGLARAVQEWKALRGEKGVDVRDRTADTVAAPPRGLRDQLERLENRVLHRSLRQSLPAPYQGRLQEALGMGEAWQTFSDRWKQYIEVDVLAQRAPFLLGFRIVQYAAYFTLLALLVVALSDEEAGSWFLREPGLASAVHVFLGILRKLFSMHGLGAVLTFCLIQVFLGAYFYRRYKARLERRARRYVGSLMKQLGRMWSGELDRVTESLKGCRDELASQRAMLAGPLDRE